MGNQVLLWSIVILPWLTIFFMKKQNIKRFIPVALLSIVYSIIAVEVGQTLNWWVVKETPYPLRSVPNVFSLNPVITMWIFQFAYGRFWLYTAIEIVANLVFAYLYLGYLLSSRNIYQFIGAGPLLVFLMTTAAGILLYCYQIWQEGIFANSHSKDTAMKVVAQPAMKLLTEEKDNKDD